MICKITNATIKCGGVSEDDIGKWLLVIQGCFLVFDSQAMAITMRAVFRSYSKYNVVAH